MDGLEKAREIINTADKEMARLFSERMRAVEKVAEYKKAHGLPILDPVREDEVIKRNSEAFSDDEIKDLYVRFIKETMSISRSYQARLLSGARVAYCGSAGAFAHIAATKLFSGAEYVPFGSFETAYKSVECGECDSVVLPIENSSNGEVGEVADLLFSGSLFVNSAIDLAITQDLLGLEDAKIEDITDVVSHPQALGQCRDYISKHGFKAHEYSNTALAAKYVAQTGNKNIAAIASSEAAPIFGLKVLEANINESRSNTTRFLSCSRKENREHSSNRDTRSILIFTVRNEAGSLAKAIEVIGSHGYNMLALRSRPRKELLWQYYFYAELEGSIHTENGAQMLAELSEHCNKLKTVGTYFSEH